MKSIVKFLFFLATVCLISLSLSNYGKAGVSKYEDLDSINDQIDAIINCASTDSTCLDIAWGNHVINDTQIGMLIDIMTDLLSRQDENITNIDSLTLEMTSLKRTIDSLQMNNKPFSSLTFNEYYNTREARNGELTVSRKLDLMIRKVEYYFDLQNLEATAVHP